MDKVAGKMSKTKRHQKLIEKKCQYPGCEVRFLGIHIAKFCPEHRQSFYRVRKLIEYENVNVKNQVLEHDNQTSISEVEMTCALNDCNAKFKINLYPTQTVYPKYCSDHRNEHKRLLHLERIQNAS